MKVVYITNRGGTHPNRIKYFDSIGAEYQFVDFKVRWHGLAVSKWRMIVSGIVCAFTFPNRKYYKLFVGSDPQLPIALMRIFRLIRRDQKVGTYLGSQTLFFLYENQFSAFTRIFYKFILRTYDFYICNGPMQAELLRRIINPPAFKIFTNVNGISETKRKALDQIQFNPESREIVFVGNLYSDWRLHYKGVDLLLNAFSEVCVQHDLQLTLVGSFDEALHRLIKTIVPDEYHSRIKIAGEAKEPELFLKNAFVYIHCSRGDALPNSLLEAMASGIPVIVSEWTGWSDLVAAINNKLVCKLSSESLLQSLHYYLDLSDDQKVDLSFRFKNITVEYTEQHAINTFMDIVHKIQKL